MDFKNKIIWSPTFYKELQQICTYIAIELNEKIVAKDLYYKIINSIISLKIFPERCPKIRNQKNKNLNIRKFIIDGYIIIYEYNATIKQIAILHIFHTSQNYLNLL